MNKLCWFCTVSACSTAAITLLNTLYSSHHCLLWHRDTAGSYRQTKGHSWLQFSTSERWSCTQFSLSVFLLSHLKWWLHSAPVYFYIWLSCTQHTFPGSLKETEHVKTDLCFWFVFFQKVFLKGKQPTKPYIHIKLEDLGNSFCWWAWAVGRW